VALKLQILVVFACYTGKLTELIIIVNMGSRSFSLGLSIQHFIVFACLLASIKFTLSDFRCKPLLQYLYINNIKI